MKTLIAPENRQSPDVRATLSEFYDTVNFQRAHLSSFKNNAILLALDRLAVENLTPLKLNKEAYFALGCGNSGYVAILNKENSHWTFPSDQLSRGLGVILKCKQVLGKSSLKEIEGTYPLLSASKGWTDDRDILNNWVLKKEAQNTYSQMGVVAYNTSEKKICIYNFETWPLTQKKLSGFEEPIFDEIIQIALAFLDSNAPKSKVKVSATDFSKGIDAFDKWQTTFLEQHTLLDFMLNEPVTAEQKDFYFETTWFPTFGGDQDTQFQALYPRSNESSSFKDALHKWTLLIVGHADDLRKLPGAINFTTQWKKFFDLDNLILDMFSEPFLSFYGVYTALTVEKVAGEVALPDINPIYEVLFAFRRKWLEPALPDQFEVIYSKLQGFKNIVNDFTTKKTALYANRSSHLSKEVSTTCTTLKLFWYLQPGVFYEVVQHFLSPTVLLLDAVCDPGGISTVVSDLFSYEKVTTTEFWKDNTMANKVRKTPGTDVWETIETVKLKKGSRKRIDEGGWSVGIKPKSGEFDDIFAKCFHFYDTPAKKFGDRQRRDFELGGEQCVVQFEIADFEHREKSTYNLNDILIFTTGEGPNMGTEHLDKRGFKIPFKGEVKGHTYYLKAIALCPGGYHWTAIVKKGQNWFHANDNYITQLSLPSGCTGFEDGISYGMGTNHWVTKKAQVLFYEKLDSSSSGKPFGILNEYNTCWSNAGLQCLFSLDSIWKKVDESIKQLATSRTAEKGGEKPPLTTKPPTKKTDPTAVKSADGSVAAKAEAAVLTGKEDGVVSPAKIVFALTYLYEADEKRKMLDWDAGLCSFSTRSAVHIRYNDNMAIATWTLDDKFTADQLPQLNDTDPVLLLSTQFYFDKYLTLSYGHSSVIHLYKKYWVLYDPKGLPSSIPERCQRLYCAITDMLQKKLRNDKYYHNKDIQENHSPFNIGVQKKMDGQDNAAGFCQLLNFTRILKFFEGDTDGNCELELKQIAERARVALDAYKNGNGNIEDAITAIETYCSKLRELRADILPEKEGGTPAKAQGPCRKVAEHIVKHDKSMDTVLAKEHRQFAEAEDNRFTIAITNKLLGNDRVFIRTRRPETNKRRRFLDLEDWYDRMPFVLQTLNSASYPIQTFRGTSHKMPKSDLYMKEVINTSFADEKNARSAIVTFLNECIDKLSSRFPKFVKGMIKVKEFLETCTPEFLTEKVFKKIQMMNKDIVSFRYLRDTYLPNLGETPIVYSDLKKMVEAIYTVTKTKINCHVIYYKHKAIFRCRGVTSKAQARKILLEKMSIDPMKLRPFKIELEKDLSTAAALTEKRAPRMALLMLGIYGTDELNAQALHNAADQVADHGRANLMFWGSAPLPKQGPSTMRIVKALAPEKEHQDREMTTVWSVESEDNADKVKLTFDDERKDENGKVIKNFWTWTNNINTERASLLNDWQESKELQELWLDSVAESGHFLTYDGKKGVWDSFIKQLEDTGASFEDDHHKGGSIKHLYAIQF